MRPYLLFSLLFLVPFVVFPLGISPFETPKVFVTEALIEVLLIVTILKTSTFPKKLHKRKAFIAICLLFLLSLIHLVFFGPLRLADGEASSSVSLFGNAFRLQGVFFLWHLLIFCVLSSMVRLPKAPYFVFLGLLALQLALSLFLGSNASERAYGTLGEPNSLAAFAVFFWPFVYFYKEKVPAWAWISSLVLSTGIILLSGSRSGLIAFGIQVVFLFAVTKLSLSIKKTVLLCFMLIAASYSLPFFENVGTFENRASVWQAAVVGGLQKPFLGYGFGNIEQGLKAGSIALENPVRFQFVDSAHNIFLDFWLQGGLFGLAIITIIITITIINFIQRADTKNLILMIGLLTVLSFNPMSVVVFIWFWWLIGQGETYKDV